MPEFNAADLFGDDDDDGSGSNGGSTDPPPVPVPPPVPPPALAPPASPASVTAKSLNALRSTVHAMSEHDATVRAMLDSVAKEVPLPLRDMVDGISHTGRSLRQLLGAGSETILPSDDRQMLPDRLAAALLMWARRRLRRSQTRQLLVRGAVRVSSLRRRLAQKMSSRPKPPPVARPEPRLVIWQGTTRLRFRVRSFLWADALPLPRLFDQVFEPSGASPSAAVAALLAKLRKQAKEVVAPQATRSVDAFRLKAPIVPDGAPIALPPPPSPLKAWRGGISSYTRGGRVGLHMKNDGVRTLTHLVELRGKIRAVVLAMGASGDDDEKPVDEDPLGACDVLEGRRWQRCEEIGDPMQTAWGYAVGERVRAQEPGSQPPPHPPLPLPRP